MHASLVRLPLSLPAVFLLAVFLLAALLLQAGCANQESYDHVYTTRARVLTLPGDKATEAFIVHHETIPDYVSLNGSIGMNAMAMPIAVPDRSVLEGIAVGDVVELTYGESFEPRIKQGLISIKKLPDDTVLAFDVVDKESDMLEAGDGFVPIFDGETLDGWEGDTHYWRVEGGSIVGEFDENNPLEANTFLIWRGGAVADFELKLEYRVSEGGNSGIQYRSQETDNFGMAGYQADIEHGPRWTGQCYDELGRGFLAKRGESVVVEAGEEPRVVEQIGDAEELMNNVDLDGWNEYRLVVKGNRFVHYINGVRMAEVVDNDEVHREMKGLLGLQLHRGQAARVGFREIYLKQLGP